MILTSTARFNPQTLNDFSGESEAQNSSTHSNINFFGGAFKLPEFVYSWIP